MRQPSDSLVREGSALSICLVYARRLSRAARQQWLAPALTCCVTLALVVTIALVLSSAHAATNRPSVAFAGTTNDPQVRTVIDLHNRNLHPMQLAYDGGRNGLWFWTSAQDPDGKLDNRIYFYDIAAGKLSSWPIYSGDWSSQILAGLALAPNGDVWIGWNHNLVVFHPADSSSTRYTLPAQPQYPLPAAVVGDQPTNLGVADLIVDQEGIVWIAREGALSLTSFTPARQSFTEYRLPPNAGDPAKLALGPDGRLLFTTDLSADHPGFILEKTGEFDPRTGIAHIYQQGAQSLAVTSTGDLYTALQGATPGLMRARGAERAAAAAQHRAPVFEHGLLPFAVDDRVLATDLHGRVWIGVAGQPKLAVFDPATGQIKQYQYAAPSIAANPPHSSRPGAAMPTAPAGAVWLRHMGAMATDSAGHLWYIRAGADVIEEVAA